MENNIMGLYLYKHPETEEIVEIFQSMIEPHIYVKDGVVYERVWTVPQGMVDGKINAWSKRAFIDKTGKKNDSLGSLWDRSKELSEKRAHDAGGIDPLAQKTLEKESKKRGGKP